MDQEDAMIVGRSRRTSSMANIPFGRFTENAQQALALAQLEAERADHSAVWSEDLLLGLQRVETGRAAKALTKLGVHINMVRSRIDAMPNRSDGRGVREGQPTSRTRAVIGVAFDEANTSSSSHVGTGHLLRGLLIESESIAAQIFRDLGVSLQEVIQELESKPKDEGPDD